MTAGGGAPGTRRSKADESSYAGGAAEVGAGGEAESEALSGSVRDQIEYMADMILELRQIAARAGLGTLSGILDLAHSEARLQSRRRG